MRKPRDLKRKSVCAWIESTKDEAWWDASYPTFGGPTSLADAKAFQKWLGECIEYLEWYAAKVKEVQGE